MGLFNNKEENDKRKAQKLQSYLDQRNLQDLSFDNLAQVIRIRNILWGTAFSNGINAFVHNQDQMIFNISEQLQGIVEQNWLLIKQNDKLREQNEKLIQLLSKHFGEERKIIFTPKLENNTISPRADGYIVLKGKVPVDVKRIEILQNGGPLHVLVDVQDGNFIYKIKILSIPVFLTIKAQGCEDQQLLIN